MNKSDSWLYNPKLPKAEIEEVIDREAIKRSDGDIGLLFHYRALIEGEWKICERGQKDWFFYVRTKKLAQYPAVEESVIRGWRKYIRSTSGIDSDKHASECEINRALVFDWLRRNPDRSSDVFKRRPQVFYLAAEAGDVDFFRAVGRLLGDGKRSKHHIAKFSYPFNVLSRWLTERYWLMPAKAVSRHIANCRKVPDDEKHLKSFLSFKSRYGLKSHTPPLISWLEQDDDYEKDVLTKHGKLLLEG